MLPDEILPEMLSFLTRQNLDAVCFASHQLFAIIAATLSETPLRRVSSIELSETKRGSYELYASTVGGTSEILLQGGFDELLAVLILALKATRVPSVVVTSTTSVPAIRPSTWNDLLNRVALAGTIGLTLRKMDLSAISMEDFHQLAQLPLGNLSLHGSILRGAWIDNVFLLRMSKSMVQLDFRAQRPRYDALFHVDNDGILAFCCALPQEQYGDYTEPRRLDMQHATLRNGLFTQLMQLHTDRRLCKRLFVQLSPVPQDLVGELAAYDDYCSGSQWCRYRHGGLTLQGKWYNFPRGLSVHFSREGGGAAGPLTCTITCVS